MIYDHLSRSALYHSISPRLASAFTALRDGKLNDAPLGRHDIDGDRVFALVQSYEAKPREKGLWEAHRNYIDLQYIVAGTELMGHARWEEATTTQPYNPEKDYELFAAEGAFLRFEPGMFAVFFPHDLHMPAITSGTAATVRKIVVKVGV
jgi:YhcH/YjgK/YiaL family protein